MNHEIIEKIKAHYHHAREKHPYFCDNLTIHPRAYMLSKIRANLNEQILRGDVYLNTILDCELVEAQEALNYRDTAAAVEECYDVIAVLLRIIDVLEGRQQLGDPAKKVGAK